MVSSGRFHCAAIPVPPPWAAPQDGAVKSIFKIHVQMCAWKNSWNSVWPEGRGWGGVRGG